MQTSQICDKSYPRLQSQQSLDIQIQNMQMKYKEFYAGIEIIQSDEFGSDLDNLEDVFNESGESGNVYDVRCLNNIQRDYNKINPRVSDIPTVYLVTCIRSQNLQRRKTEEKQDWEQKILNKGVENSRGKCQSPFQSKKQNNKYLLNYSTPSHINGQSYNTKFFIIPQKRQRSGSKNYRNIFAFKNLNMEDFKWKTQTILIKSEWITLQQKQRKIMHNLISKLEENLNKNKKKNVRKCKGGKKQTNNMVGGRSSKLSDNFNEQNKEYGKNYQKIQSINDKRSIWYNQQNIRQYKKSDFICKNSFANFKPNRVYDTDEQHYRAPYKRWILHQPEKPKTKYICLNLIMMNQENGYQTQNLHKMQKISERQEQERKYRSQNQFLVDPCGRKKGED